MTTNDFLLLMSSRSRRKLHGWVDMHAHPMAHLGFSGKLIHGGVDIGSLLPKDNHGNPEIRANNIAHALCPDNCTHGSWDLNNQCGDTIREQVIRGIQEAKKLPKPPGSARGFPDFPHWPAWNNITHQKMWVDWIRRAHWAGLRVMVALAVHNQTLAAAVGGPGDGPMDDVGAMELQIEEIKAFVSRHDFMQVAYSPEELRNIVSQNKLAIVLGVEIDAIGNFHKGTNPSFQMIKNEILRLYGIGIRYIFPIHLIDNIFGGTAIYEKIFNWSNYREYGDFWELQESKPNDEITWVYEWFANPLDDIEDFLIQAPVRQIKLGIPPVAIPPQPPSTKQNTGHMNSKGLTSLGKRAIKEMMRLGMMIDIDHMSQKSANEALDIAETEVGDGYPLNSGHNGPRASTSPNPAINLRNTELHRTKKQIQRIADLGGMFGLGTDDIDAPTFVKWYDEVFEGMGNRGVAFGTDMNGMAMGPMPRPVTWNYSSEFPKCKVIESGTTWDYRVTGVAHYGMLADFLYDIKSLPGGSKVFTGLYRSAEDFALMWERCEFKKNKVLP